MEETSAWLQVHIKESNACKFLEMWWHSYLQKRKIHYKKITKEESFPSLSVRQNRAVHVHKVKHFIPQHSRVQLRTRF